MAARCGGLLLLLLIGACEQAPSPVEVIPDPRVVAIHETTVFVDMHAHPSRFHRENVETTLREEIEVYRRSTMDIVVANISSDMANDGRYTNRDGSFVDKGKYKPEPGEEANFHAITAELLDRGYSDEDVGKVMGGNFFRVWQAVTATPAS